MVSSWCPWHFPAFVSSIYVWGKNCYGCSDKSMLQTEFVVCLVILLAAQRRSSSFMWPAGKTTKMANTRERDFMLSTASSLSFWLILFISHVRQTNPKTRVSCLMSSVSWGCRIRGCFSEMRKPDAPGRTQRLCQACWHCVVMSHKHFSPRVLLFIQFSYFFHKEVVIWQRTLGKSVHLARTCRKKWGSLLFVPRRISNMDSWHPLVVSPRRQLWC